MKRQYVLPSCSLILEGLSTDTTEQEMSILANAECRIVGLEPALNGGLEFFKSLVDTVSQYAQGMLSRLPRPTPPDKLVQLAPKGGAYHRLTVAARPEVDPALEEPVELILSTVQLFDLTDAVDQFLADSQTLPELSLQVKSLPRRAVKSDEPMSKRVVPPLLGVGSLAIAAAGLFMLPIPEVPEFDPESIEPVAQIGSQAPGTGLDDGPDPNVDAAAGDAAEGVAGPVAGTPTDPTSEESGTNAELSEAEALTLSAAEVSQLQAQLEADLAASQPDSVQFDETLTYEVSVDENGDILGYRPVNPAALDKIEQTPLPALTYIPIGEETVEPAAQFSVSFVPDGSLVVAPWSGDVLDDPGAQIDSEDEDLSE